MTSKTKKQFLHIIKSILVFLIALSWIFSPFTNTIPLPKKLAEKLEVQTAYAITDVFTRASGTNSAGYGSWVAPGGVTEAIVACWGGGGGGKDGTDSGGGKGGGGGGFASSTVSVTVGTQYTIFIGAGGAGGTSDGAGLNGATSTFATTTVIAAMGQGGTGDTTVGGTGGLATHSTGTTKANGGNGGDGTSTNDLAGGGGGAGGPHGAGAVGDNGASAKGGAGGQGDNAHGGAAGAQGNGGAGGAGGASILGGGGGGGGDTAQAGGVGGIPGGGGGAGEAGGEAGASGRCEIVYTAATGLTQDGYRWRANHQGETGTTWLAAEDTVITGANNTTASTTRLRILVDETKSLATTTLYQLEYATSTSAGCSALTYVRVADQASSTGYAWKMSPTAQFANAAASTNIADPNGLTDTTGSFRAGVTQDTTARISSGIAHAAGEFTELEWSIEGTILTNGRSYCFRVTNADDTTNFTYSAYPKINLATTTELNMLHYRWRADNGLEGAFGGNGATTTYMAGNATAYSIAIDANSIYVSGTQIGSGAGDVCTAGFTCWRIGKYDITTGAAVNAFGTNGATTTYVAAGGVISQTQTIAIDGSFIYVGGYQTVSGAGDICAGGFICWRLGKYDITTGAAVNAFGGNGATTTDAAGTAGIHAVAVDANFIYAVGDQTGSGAGDVCTAGIRCWRINKYDITTGAAVNAFGTNGATTTITGSFGIAYDVTVDANYIYVAGDQTGSGSGETCTAAELCWRINKYDITTGEAVNAFSDNGATTTYMAGTVDPEDITVDANYIYVAGRQTGSGAGETCKASTDCWRINKYDITTGAAVNAFSDNGATTTYMAGAAVTNGITVDANYIYVAGYQNGSGAGDVCTAGVQCWRIQKYDITTGAVADEGASWLAAEDVPLTGANVATASTTRLRILVDETDGGATTTLYQLEYATSTIAGYTSCSALSTWVPVQHAASTTEAMYSYAWVATTTANYANRSVTANNSGLTDPSSGSFTAGQIMDYNATTTALTLSGDNFTELEWALEATSEADGDSYCFRVTNADSTTDFTYTAYPRISIATSTLTYTQNRYRLYVDNNSLNPGTAWDGLTENAPMTSANERVGGGDVVRMRMNVNVSSALSTNATAFSIQYAQLSSGACSALTSWTPVGAKGSDKVFRLANTSQGDSTTIVTTLLSDSNVGGLLSELNPSATNPNSATAGQKIEYDWPVQYSSALFSGATFCFRMVEGSATAFTTYTQYPQILTNFVGAGASDTVGAPVGGAGAKGAATTTGGTSAGGGESGGAPPAGGGNQGGGGAGGGGEVRIPFFRYFASILTGTVELVVKFIEWKMGN